ncbi:MAG: hypothetical protein QXT40_00440 [Candidatus Micrarchaeia archaeon]
MENQFTGLKTFKIKYLFHQQMPVCLHVSIVTISQLEILHLRKIVMVYYLRVRIIHLYLISLLPTTPMASYSTPAPPTPSPTSQHQTIRVAFTSSPAPTTPSPTSQHQTIRVAFTSSPAPTTPSPTSQHQTIRVASTSTPALTTLYTIASLIIQTMSILMELFTKTFGTPLLTVLQVLT